MLRSVLIANRGEIACRIAHTAKRLGMRTIAVYSEADAGALHTRSCDEAYLIGGSEPRASYLAIDHLIAAAKQARAECVHPGYGFLSENADFADACAQAGLVFVGPPASAIRAMGLKDHAKKLMERAGVPVVPGYHGDRQDAKFLKEKAYQIGYPVLIKPAAGGGGRGMRLVDKHADFDAALEGAVRESQSAFGTSRVLIEKFVPSPRHIEIQVFADNHGNAVHLGERDCSLQRRHQKVIEEAPAPGMIPELRAAIGNAAVAAAKAVDYRGAGTVEFVVDGTAGLRANGFWFIEMNTRLQVEHPVTEAVTGLDLVEQMIRVAAGERLAFKQQDLKLNGWALECRINAEDPFRNFLPSVGRLVKYIPPEEVEGQVRVDTGVYEGGEISMYYDSMIAKLITHGATRDHAIARMRDALNAFVIRGVSSNVAFQAALMEHPRFVSGKFTTAFIAEEFPKGFHPSNLTHDAPLLLASVAAFARRRHIDRATKTSGQLAGHRRRVGSDWVVRVGTERFALRVEPIDGGYAITSNGEKHELKSDWKLGEILFRGTWNDEEVCMQIERVVWRYRILHRGTQADVEVLTARAAQLLSLMPEKPKPDRSKLLLSPMPGLLAEIAVKPGQEIKAGEKLAVIEAMKMENTLKAERDGVVAEVLAKAGESLAVDQAILRFE